MQALLSIMLLVGLFAGPAIGQEYTNYVVATGKLVEKSKVREVTGILRQTKLWVTGSDLQTHPACIVQIADSTQGVFVLDYRPTSAIGKSVRIKAVVTTPIANPQAEVRSPASKLDSSIGIKRRTKCYVAVRDATKIDYILSRQQAASGSQ